MSNVRGHSTGRVVNEDFYLRLLSDEAKAGLEELWDARRNGTFKQLEERWLNSFGDEQWVATYREKAGLAEVAATGGVGQ